MLFYIFLYKFMFILLAFEINRVYMSFLLKNVYLGKYNKI